MFLAFVLVRVVSLTETAEIPISEVRIRSFGDPATAMVRIKRDNFTSLEKLDSLTHDPNLSPLRQLVYQYAPLLILPIDEPFPATDDTFIGVYFDATENVQGDTEIQTIQYFYLATDENGGTIAPKRLALFGQPIDRELIYRITIINGKVAGTHVQTPIHRLARFDYPDVGRPVFAVASANHNFRVVYPAELEARQDYRLLVPRPYDEHVYDPAHDPDFVALAAQEALIQHHIDLSQYIYVEFQNPVVAGLTTVSVKIRGHWYYLHDSIAGLTRTGYNQVGIYLGFTPAPRDIDELRIASFTSTKSDFDVYSVYIYPGIRLLD